MSDKETVKERLPIVRYLEKRGFQTDTGAHINPSPCCEHNDCFSLNISSNVFKCHSCDAGGDLFSLHQILSGLDFKEALADLAEEAGVRLEVRTQTGKGAEENGVAGVWNLAVEVYHAGLMSNGAMVGYQEKTRGHERRTLARFKIGWANGKLADAVAKRKFAEKTLLCSGLFRKRGENLIEVFRDCFVYPSFDAAGRPLHFRSKIPKGESRKENGSQVQLTSACRDKGWICYNQGILGKHEEILVCEGEDDLLTWHESRRPNVVATCGGPSGEFLDFLVKNHPGKKYLLAYDNDQAGRAYVDRFFSRGLTIRVLPAPACATPHADRPACATPHADRPACADMHADRPENGREGGEKKNV